MSETRYFKVEMGNGGYRFVEAEFLDVDPHGNLQAWFAGRIEAVFASGAWSCYTKITEDVFTLMTKASITDSNGKVTYLT